MRDNTIEATNQNTKIANLFYNLHIVHKKAIIPSTRVKPAFRCKMPRQRLWENSSGAQATPSKDASKSAPNIYIARQNV
jgi:hypothetical protein